MRPLRNRPLPVLWMFFVGMLIKDDKKMGKGWILGSFWRRCWVIGVSRLKLISPPVSVEHASRRALFPVLKTAIHGSARTITSEAVDHQTANENMAGIRPPPQLRPKKKTYAAQVFGSSSSDWQLQSCRCCCRRYPVIAGKAFLVLWAHASGESEFPHDFYWSFAARWSAMMLMLGVRKKKRKSGFLRHGMRSWIGRKRCWRWLSMGPIDEWMVVSIDGSMDRYGRSMYHSEKSLD